MLWKWFKRLSLIFFVLLIGAAGLVWWRLNHIKEPLLAALKSRIRGDIRIETADISWNPVGLKLKGVQLFAEGESQPAASMDQAELKIELIPLLRKEINIDLSLDQPTIRFIQDAQGPSNMERIFAPSIQGEPVPDRSPDMWWKQLKVKRLKIENGHFLIQRVAKETPTEIKNLSIYAENIAFDQPEQLGRIELSYLLPQVSATPMELKTALHIDAAKSVLTLRESQFVWGPLRMDLSGDALLKGAGDVILNFAFEGKDLDLAALEKLLKEPIPARGRVSVSGKVQGSAFAPEVTLKLNSPQLSVSGKTLSPVSAEIRQSGDKIKIQQAQAGIYGGSVALSGEIAQKKRADLNIQLKSLSVAALSEGKTNLPARLSGQLKVSVPDLKQPKNLSASGPITVGPIPLPSVNLENKVKIAEILAAGTGMGKMVNLGMLKNSHNLIGSRVEQVQAQIAYQTPNLTIKSYQLGNDHFSAAGSGKILAEKTLDAGGTFSLKPGVTNQLLPDARFRNYLTQGRGLNVPFSANGPLSDPNVQIDQKYLNDLIRRATTAGLTNLLQEGIQPDALLNEALKKTPLSKSPLQQILGAPQNNPRSPNTTTQPRTQPRQSPTRQRRDSQKINLDSLFRK